MKIVRKFRPLTVRPKALAPWVYKSSIRREELRDDDLYAVMTYNIVRGYYKTKVFEGFRLKYGDLRSLGITVRERQRSKTLVVGGPKYTFVYVKNDTGFEAQHVDVRKWEGSAQTINRVLGWENI